jgi:hypothetical protein
MPSQEFGRPADLLMSEIENANRVQDEHEHPAFTAVGYIAGEILQLGPDYMSLVGSSSAAQD